MYFKIGGISFLLAVVPVITISLVSILPEINKKKYYLYLSNLHFNNQLGSLLSK